MDKTIVCIDGKSVDLRLVPIYSVLLGATLSETEHGRLIGMLEDLTMTLGSVRDNMDVTTSRQVIDAFQHKGQGLGTVAEAIIQTVATRGKRETLYILAAYLVRLLEMGKLPPAPQSPIGVSHNVTQYYSILYHLAGLWLYECDYVYSIVRERLHELYVQVSDRVVERQSSSSFYTPWNVTESPHEQLFTLVTNYLAMNDPSAVKDALLSCRVHLATIPSTTAVPPPAPVPATATKPSAPNPLEARVTALEDMLIKTMGDFSDRLTQVEGELRTLAEQPARDAEDVVRLSRAVAKLSRRFRCLEITVDCMEDELFPLNVHQGTDDDDIQEVVRLVDRLTKKRATKE